METYLLASLQLPLQGTLQLGSILALLPLLLSQPACMALLLRLLGRARRPHCESLVGQPCLEHTTHDIQCSSLNYTGPDLLTPPNSDVDDALEGQ